VIGPAGFRKAEVGWFGAIRQPNPFHAGANGRDLRGFAAALAAIRALACKV
jgi:hypothetical protein